MSYECVTGPSGPGLWVAFAKQLGGYATIAETIQSMNFKVVYPRAGDTGNNDGSWTKEACQSLVNAGLEVYPWRYSRGGKSNWTRELEGYKRDLEWGAQGIVVDAEIHWGNEHKDEAHLFVDELLELNCFVADAPWPYIGWHPEYPDAFGRLHARMPQLYWTEISTQGAKHHMTQMRKQWSEWEAKQRSEGKDYLIKPLWPIGVTYGKHELAKLGAKGCPGTFYLQDLKDFISMNEEDPKALWSLFTLEASAPTALGYLRSLYAPSNLCL